MPDSTDDIAQHKAALRKKLRFRRAHHVENLVGWEKSICFSQIPRPMADFLKTGSTVAFYVAYGDEPDIARIAIALAEQGHALALPRTGPTEGTMDFTAYRPGDALEPSAHGIDQPAVEAPIVAPDIVLCPLLGFNRAMRRIGHGGGYYDRAFARYPNATRIGVAWSVQEEETIPTEPHDIALHAVMTESEWIVAS
ncbi:MAG: 5-formyltetrahydrofolate cyclo-ligase [Sphingomonadales bacterium]|nr:5-formyltetrahydrofolate cyclo-ligase [Sphingomonadales bacterium]